MSHPRKSLLSSLLTVTLLFLHPIAQAESSDLAWMSEQLQQLQAQLTDVNGKITTLEIALKAANQNISTLQRGETLNSNSRIQSDLTNSIAPRTANGHGR